MPVMDGITAVKRIRQDEEEGRVERRLVIALTGNARQEQIEQACEAGMDDGESPRLCIARVTLMCPVVIKPYKLPALLTRIEEAIRSTRLVD